MTPNLKEENKLWKQGYKKVAGIDEVGRGPLAGPVIACAVVINGKKPEIKNVKDSKQLSAKKREEIYKILTKHLDIEWGIGIVSEKIIDKINILEATKLAMQKAIKNLESKMLEVEPLIIDFLILDGNFSIKTAIPQKSIIKADEKVFSCSCASIIAKVTRDRMMRQYHAEFPRYRFDLHKGYSTQLHRKMLKKYGLSKIHRKSFKPVGGLFQN